MPNSSVQLTSANSGHHYQMIKLRDEKSSSKYNTRSHWYFPEHPQSSPSCLVCYIAHRRTTEAKCYFKDPLNQFINEYLLQGTVLGTIESTWKRRPMSLPSRSLQSSWEDKAYIQGKVSNNTGVRFKCKITVQEISKMVPYEIPNEGLQQIQRKDLTRTGIWEDLTNELECWGYPRTVDIWVGE